MIDHHSNRIRLAFYDALIYFGTCLLLWFVQPDVFRLEGFAMLVYFLVGLIVLGILRIAFGVYRQVWRYGSIYAYMRLLAADFFGGAVFFFATRLVGKMLDLQQAYFSHVLLIVCVNLLASIAARMIYHRFYLAICKRTRLGMLLQRAIALLTGVELHPNAQDAEPVEKIGIAIVGAGRVGVTLAEELRDNSRAKYEPRFFIESDRRKSGRTLCEIPIVYEGKLTKDFIEKHNVREIVFAIAELSQERQLELFNFYKQFGCKLKKYDYATLESADGGRRTVREFDIEELLFRKPNLIADEKTNAYYQGKTIFVTGGGGSIGNELCRQIARMHPRRLVILDICENGAYDIQQELRIAHGDDFPLSIEIVSMCDRMALEAAFALYHPDIVLHAAAHKHVPLMEHNCCEAVKNNVFGTLNVVELSEKYGVERFIMVSTDKAVNPTNVMGATKRMCEMIVQSHSLSGSGTKFSATRFGNVLGSAGSVIPLFKRQIQNGGPITLTDRRIIRYFMTIPEASNLVLQSGAMAQNGELFVLDMGRPIKILDLAENMIRLSGFTPYKDIDICETGLRPGEKLYEELLIKSEELSRTENELIFIERDTPISAQDLQERLAILREAVASGEDSAAKQALRRVVPTYYSAKRVNADAERSEEMAQAR